MVKRLAILLLSPIAGGAIGFGLAYLWLSGWFTPWRLIELPPEKASRILAVNGLNIWIEATSGAIYHNPSSEGCESNCWVSVTEVTPPPVSTPAELEVIPHSCVSPPPLLGVIESKAECWRDTWRDYNTIYALRRDGTLLVWRYASGGEWGLFALISSTCMGAVVLFAAVLLVRFFRGVLKWVNDRAQKTNQTT